ncbi:acyltransferase family protein [Ferruginibacter sp.]
MQTVQSAENYITPFQQQRLLSLDVMRGLIMILLAAESCLVYSSLNDLYPTGFSNYMVQQFFHHPWHGLLFWDLVQPAFMTMAGAALYISFYFKQKKGITWKQNFKHILVRSVKLFICGTALHCVYAGKTVWELWNVLTQLSVTTVIAYLIIKRSAAYQITVAVLLLLLTEFLYRFVLMPGYDEPFVEHKNFGAWFDTLLMGKINTDGWVAINFIPTAAHTICGVLVGKLLIAPIEEYKKLKILFVAAAITLMVGYGLNILNITPIIKRISTSSFVVVSAGWVILMMAFLYWLTDIKDFKKYAWIFVVVGTNAIFIYLFFETVGLQWLNNTVAIFVNGFTDLFAAPDKLQAVINALVTLCLEWGLCYWLFLKKIFFKL